MDPRHVQADCKPIECADREAIHMSRLINRGPMGLKQEHPADRPKAGITLPRRHPPYGRLLTERLRDPQGWHRWWGTAPDGRHVSIWVLVGPSAWETARAWIDTRLLAVAPPTENPGLFDWHMLAGHPPVVVWSCGIVSQDELDCLAAALIRDGVERLVVLRLDASTRYLSERTAA